MTEKIKIIADDKIPFLRGVLEPYVEISYLQPAHITSEIVREADALIIRTRTKCDAELLNDSKVKLIATATIGIDHIDAAFCKSKGIKWINAPGCNSGSVQQYIASALLTLARLNDFQLDKKTIGIVGVGNVGSKVEKIAKIFGMNVLLNDPPRERNESGKKFVSLDHIIEKADIITFHVPLNINGIDKTFHLVDEGFFKKLNKGKILINTSRGEVIETSSLKRAIGSGKVTASVLDVWENEPEIDTELLNLVTFATPHIAGYATEGKANGTSMSVNALNGFFNLGLRENWYPDNLPLPTGPNEIKIECTEKTKQEVMFECINSTYNIIEDDKRLRNAVNNFEIHRAEYPVRREFNFYDVCLHNADESLEEAINQLKFNVLNK